MTNSDADDGKESTSEGTRLGHRVLDESQSDGEDSGERGDEYVNGAHRKELTAQNILQVQQQQSQGAAVDWERFLHVRSIKVLLVENDDCTRHIVTALLRNCSYEVIEAVHGAHAWKILEDLTNQVDLVLTEVVTLCLSGVGLLYKIMNHRTRKNIPVIMMSSHDSMGLVFKCLSKGAVDFLVKPIRKNELKNLWQHVWRRCHSSSGSGSESGTQTQNSIHTHNSEKSDGSSSSNAGESDGSDNINNVDESDDESDDGSGSQNSWTKQPLPRNISLAPSSTNQLAKCPDINSAPVIQPYVEASSNKRVDIAANNQGQKEDQCVFTDPLPEITNHLESEPPADICARVTGGKTNNLFEVPSSSCSSRTKNVNEDPRGELHGNRHKVNIASSHSQMIGREFKPPKELTSRQLVNNGHMDNPSEKTVELSLKRLRGIKGSELSAFSRYYTSTSAPQGITGTSYRNVDSSLEDGNKDSLCVQANGNLVFPVSVSSNNIDMGSTTSKSFANPILFRSESASAVDVAFKPVKNDMRHTPLLGSPHMPISMQTSSVLSPTSGVQLGHQIQHTDVHHYDHHYHLYHTFDVEQKLSSYEKSSMKKPVADAGHSGLLDLNAMAGYKVGDHDNCCLNRSARGGNHGSNEGPASGLNQGDSGAVDGRNEGRDASVSGFGNRVNESKSAQREATVLKFLQKRKERCFKKKVRYENRKILAEQRPRVRGQFVRQTDHDSSYEADE